MHPQQGCVRLANQDWTSKEPTKPSWAVSNFHVERPYILSVPAATLTINRNFHHFVTTLLTHLCMPTDYHYLLSRPIVSILYSILSRLPQMCLMIFILAQHVFKIICSLSHYYFVNLNLTSPRPHLRRFSSWLIFLLISSICTEFMRLTKMDFRNLLSQPPKMTHTNPKHHDFKTQHR